MSDQLVLSHDLIERLIERGVISPHCTAFVLVAKMGEPIRLRETRYVSESESALLGQAIETTDTYSPESTHPGGHA